MLKEFADNDFKFDEYGRKSSERIENTVGKGEIAHYEQFLLFPQCFQKTCTADTLKPGLVWERVKNIVGKEEIARNQQFLLYPQCFLLNQIIVSPFVCTSNIISFFAVELEEPKIGM